MKHPIDTSQWGEFKAWDLFGPSKLGKYHNPKDLHASDDGYEYICATTRNNGINQTLSCVIGNNLTIPFKIGGDLSLTPSHIIAWGKQNPYFTYHENPCVTSQGMYFVEVKNKTRNQIHFLITVLNKLSSEFSYTNCLTGKLFDELSVPLPLKQGTNPTDYTQDDIDWDYMDTVMSRVTARAKERLASLPQPTDKKKTPVDTSRWGEFKLGDMFEFMGSKQVKSQHNLIESDKENGIPFVVQSNQNNMVKCYVTKESLIDNNENIYKGNVLVLGVVTPVTSYQKEDFGASQSIILKSDKLNPLRGQFLASVIRSVIESKYNYTNIPGIQKYKQDVIPLPLKPSADPSNYTQDDIDWTYMDCFMQAIEEKAHERLVELNSYMNEDD